jgi:ketosteroid isomerase-like protein
MGGFGMNFIKIVLVVGILSLFMIQSGNTGSIFSSKVQFDAEKCVEKWVKFWNTYDLDQVDELFLQDDRLSYFSSEKEGAIFGFDSVREYHKGFGFIPGGKEQPNKLWVEDIHFADFNSTVIVTGIWCFQKPDSPKQRGPVTIVYIRQGDRFKIAHMNFSEYKDYI